MNDLCCDAFSVSSIENVISELDKLQNSLIDYRVNRFCEALAAYGQQIAQQTFDTEGYYAGDRNVVVTSEKTEDGWRVLASGQAVCFIEFGAGVYYNPGGQNYPGNVPDGIVDIGEYGRGLGKGETWWFYGDEAGTEGDSYSTGYGGYTITVTFGNPPLWAMWGAAQEMRKEAVNIARKIFGGKADK